MPRGFRRSINFLGRSATVFKAAQPAWILKGDSVFHFPETNSAFVDLLFQEFIDMGYPGVQVNPEILIVLVKRPMSIPDRP